MLAHNSSKMLRDIMGDNPADEDFWSARKLSSKRKAKNVSECVMRSLSVFDNYDVCRDRMKKLPYLRKKMKNIVEITLVKEDGLKQKTFGAHHYSWWRSKEFDISKSKLVD